MANAVERDTPAPVLCVGEVLWDVLPTGQFIGGAPLNVAAHLRALGQPALIASRIGTDDLGQATRSRIAKLGLGDTLVQADPLLPTGRVNVKLIDAVTPTYDIKQPAAWDAIEVTPALCAAADACRAMVFGTLAQRDVRSRAAIETLIHRARFRVFDINLRPPFFNRGLIEHCLAFTDLLKLNDGELQILREWFGLPASEQAAARAIADRFGCETICLTRGANGAALLLRGEWLEHPGYAVEAVDPVGAGDSFLAALLDGLLADRNTAAMLDRACAVGAYVATQPSATPVLDAEAIAKLQQSHP